MLEEEYKEERCRAKCRDGTGCLNRAKSGSLCWKHLHIYHRPILNNL